MMLSSPLKEVGPDTYRKETLSPLAPSLQMPICHDHTEAHSPHDASPTKGSDTVKHQRPCSQSNSKCWPTILTLQMPIRYENRYACDSSRGIAVAPERCCCPWELQHCCCRLCQTHMSDWPFEKHHELQPLRACSVP